MKTAPLAFALSLLLAAPALRAEAPARDEGALFGGEEAAQPAEKTKPAKKKTKQTKPAAEAAKTPVPAEESAAGAALESRPQADAFARGSTKDNPLEIGGTYYQQWQASFAKLRPASEASQGLPLQADLFLDARPNERLRAFVEARLLYDAAKDAYGRGAAGSGGLNGLQVPSSGTAQALPNNPQVVLDQAWLKFDLERTLFLSLGKQHIKWGTGRLWNPSDALNPQRRDPLQPYDLRLGSSMLVAQLPWEKEQANLYAIALFDNPSPASSQGSTGGAFRAEALLGNVALGLDAVTRAGKSPVYGADLSSPLGPLDVYAEAALLTGWQTSYHFLAKPTPGGNLDDVFSESRSEAPKVLASAGANFTFAWTENRSATLGAEYFYNPLGVDDGNLIPVLVLRGTYQPFYVGQHYAALYLSAEGPDAGKKSSYNLSVVGNLTDRSAVARLDFGWRFLDALSFGAWAAGHFGSEGGEFNFALDTPALLNGSSVLPPVSVPALPVELGMSFRMAY